MGIINKTKERTLSFHLFMLASAIAGILDSLVILATLGFYSCSLRLEVSFIRLRYERERTKEEGTSET